MGMGKKKEPLIYKGSCGGRNRTRTCDPIDVNDVLYQLSHATIMELGEPIGNFHCRAVDRFFRRKMRETVKFCRSGS